MPAKPRVRYRVELEYETMGHENAIRIYHVESTNGQSAIKTAMIRLERLSNYKIMISGVAKEVISY